MATQNQVQVTQVPSWVWLAVALPAFLITISGVAEGFPNPPLPIQVMVGMNILAVALLFIFLAKRWMGMGLFLYSVITSFATLALLDEIASSYKTPFTIVAALIVIIPVLFYRFGPLRRRWDVLVIGGLLVMLAINYIANSYWQMTDLLGFTSCYPDCLPVSGEQPNWWQVLIGALG